MTVFAWTVKDKSGRPMVREVPAETVAEAKQILLAEGCTDLVLREDEIMAAATASMRANSPFSGEEIEVTAADRLKYRGKPPPTFFKVLLESVTKASGPYLLMVPLLAYSIYRGRFVQVAEIGVVMLAWPLVVTWIKLPGIYYARLHKANDWHRWTEMLDIVNKLERLNHSHFIKIPAPELARNRAKAEVGLGRLSEALERYQRFENQPGCPSWLYKAHLAGLYDTAKDHDKALEWTLKAIAEKPSTALYIDLMNRLVRYKRDPIRARAVLAEVEKGTVTDIGKPFLARCRGILAYLEGDNATARKELEAALAALEQRHQPFRDGGIALTKAYLSCVLARQGEMAAARKQFAEAKDYLVATEETELLAECQRMVG